MCSCVFCYSCRVVDQFFPKDFLPRNKVLILFSCQNSICLSDELLALASHSSNNFEFLNFSNCPQVFSLLNNCIFPEKSSSLFTVVLLQVLSYKNEPSTICYGTFTCSLCSSNCLVTVHASTLLSSGVVGRMFIYIGFNN